MKDVFQWDDNFKTNNKIIDQQHIQLIELINKNMRYSFNQDLFSNDLYLEMKKNLTKYIQLHFTTEEKIMSVKNVFEAHSIEHKKLHYEFISWFEDCFSQNTYESIEKINELLEYLINWLAYHILNTDKRLFKQIELIESGISPEVAFEMEKEKSDDSTEPLVKALKTLYHMVLEKNNELEKYNISLEQNVRQRTAELEEANKRLEAIALTDQLTGLPNRRFTEILLENILGIWNRYKTDYVVMFIDIDKFKIVNDLKGHDVGDLLLKWIANFLKVNLRKSDTICRFGGDEFVVICPETNLENGLTVGNNIIEAIKKSTNIEFNDIWLPSLSIGLCQINNDSISVESIIKNADKAMYISKKNGGNLTTAST